ncbi:hypothetical protein [Sporomusa aerivorans]|uniref:hypothetical protein n=1 Tax=Sporomusa aerivorans TaxID=204936 RepID=UPI00352A74AF
MLCYKDFKPTPISYVSVMILLLTITFGWLLPADFGKENGPVEWTQVVILSLATLVALSASWQKHIEPSRRKLFAVAAVGLFLSIGRELSWGRALYMDSTGYIPPLKQLWFGPYVYPMLAALILGTIGYFFINGLHKELLTWLKHDSIPLFDLAVVLIAILVADTIEHHSFGFFGERTELFEELWELASYTGVLSFMINIVFNKQFTAKPQITEQRVDLK